MARPRPLVLYHANCADGFCAAWVAHQTFGNRADYQPVQYGQAPPDAHGRHSVYLLDFCYPREQLEALARQSLYTFVLDHHRSRVPDMAGRYYEAGQEEQEQFYGHGTLICRYHPGKSGARLAWEYFHGGPAPWLVDYVEDRDLWRWKLPDSREISAAIASYPFDFGRWDEWEGYGPGSDTFGEMVEAGKAILRYQAQQVASICSQAREVEVGGHRVLAACTSVLFSEVAGTLAEGRPFGAAWFVRKDGRKQWSLRSVSDGIDVSEVARSLGGGGHKHAAGFEE